MATTETEEFTIFRRTSDADEWTVFTQVETMDEVKLYVDDLNSIHGYQRFSFSKV